MRHGETRGCEGGGLTTVAHIIEKQGILSSGLKCFPYERSQTLSLIVGTEIGWGKRERGLRRL